MKIGIIGAGWYGSHLALALKKEGHDVTLFERNSRIFSGISGSFGIRLHLGPHYPRSPETRKSCQRCFSRFKEVYPELVVPHEYAIYALGAKDADNNPPRVDEQTFKAVCEETSSCHPINMEEYGYKGLLNAFNLDEPSMLLGEPLRQAFTQYLEEAGVKVVCDYTVSSLHPDGDLVTINNTSGQSQQFDKVINATSYQSLLPQDPDFPFNMETIYQPCLGLIYRDKQAGTKPISFIAMDGWFPCLMPLCENEGDSPVDRRYILTHGKWTIMGSYERPAAAKEVLASLTDSFVDENIRAPAVSEMKRFWPDFEQRFEYVGWKGQVLAKLKTRREFRSAVTYGNGNIIHVVPGKVSNVFDVEDEVKALIAQENILYKGKYSYMRGGVLDHGIFEIEEKPSAHEANTANLQTFSELRATVSNHNFFNTSKAPTRHSFLKTNSLLLCGSLMGLGLSVVFPYASLYLLSLSIILLATFAWHKYRNIPKEDTVETNFACQA
ncbi:glycine oxidase ThiO [Legionella adelaidensis]|uniref:Glycine oxidase ThiO n=1 Tax=Legionella adelaidensis TaxID=45056 RepID=A0A0W0R6F7_9GAMM|nr:FAD-dependent oxidoreductase [Legionella adelaidensis]KTC66624.1 hypothetical protein Lade_1282 [Legionella adelaidensis]VEH81050.1 glycine oxidase ThiO [Legionella adelaidensis]